MLSGIIDISAYQGHPRFDEVKAGGVIAVIMKASQGTGHTDAVYAANKSAARAHGLLVGSYHFGDGSDPVAQAEHFLSVAKPVKGDLLVLDLESNPGGASMTVAQSHAFVRRIQSATGRWPGLYSGGYLKDSLGTFQDSVLVNCWAWVAQYSDHVVVQPTWKTWTMWQRGNGTVPVPHPTPGVGHCDWSVFNGDLLGLHRLWGID